MTRASGNSGRVGPRRDAQGEVAAQREAAEAQRQFRNQLGDARHGADHLADPVGVEQLHVQVVAGAVVAQVQPDHRPALGVHARGGRQQVRGVPRAFPAVNQHGEPARGLRRLRRVPAMQPHALPAIQQQAATDRRQGRGPAPQQAAPERRARQDRLQMRVRDQPGGRELHARLSGHRQPRS
jgi:hypothetical protein